MRAVTTAGAQGAAQPLADHGCVAADRGRRHGLRVGLVLVASVAKAVSATLKQHIFPAMLVIIVAI